MTVIKEAAKYTDRDLEEDFLLKAALFQLQRN